MRIAFTGTHSTGKTTLLNTLKQDIRFKDYYFADEITRVIKKCGYNINEFGDDETQKVIMSSHVENMKFDDIVMDRCSLDGYCYTKYLYEKNKITKDTLDTANTIHSNIINNYDVIFYLTPEFELIEDGVRSTNMEFRDRVAEIFEEEIKKVKTKIIPLKGTIDERVLIINNFLRNE